MKSRLPTSSEIHTMGSQLEINMEIINVTKQNRSYSEFDSLVIILASLYTALEYKRIGKADCNPGDSVLLEGLSSRKMIRMPLYGPIEAALNNLKPDLIEITIEDLVQSTQIYQVNISSLQKTINYICMPHFVSFYEANISEAENKFGETYSIWPASWRMGWVVRNALSHNRKIYYKNPTTPAVAWRSATISPSMQDTPIETVMNFTDIILLILDMDNDLN